MGDIYRKGSHYVTCDRTGLKTRVEDVRREYTGAIVRRDQYEPRHPQDFVRMKRREEGGPAKPSRPDPLWQFMGALTTTLAAAASPGDVTLEVSLSTRFFGGDRVGIMLDTGEVFRATVASVADSTHLSLLLPMPRAAAAGALITNYSAVTAANIG